MTPNRSVRQCDSSHNTTFTFDHVEVHALSLFRMERCSTSVMLCVVSFCDVSLRRFVTTFRHTDHATTFRYETFGKIICRFATFVCTIRCTCTFRYSTFRYVLPYDISLCDVPLFYDIQTCKKRLKKSPLSYTRNSAGLNKVVSI